MDAQKPQMFQTDLNERERSRYAKMFRGLSEQAIKTAEALEASPYDDSKFVVNFIVLSLLLSGLSELSRIVQDAATKEAPPEFPPFING